jgi:WD40 repeat protein
VSFAAVVERLRRVENPYPGLRPFETKESHLFFGRNQQVADLVGRLERNRFVAVLGVSGTGKSSLVRAGLIPALERGRISEAGRRWRIVVTRPAGVPFESLAADLAKAGLDASGLASSSHGLIEIARQLPSDESLLVIVDQFEELFRYKDLASISEETRRRRDASAADAAEFVQLLLAASRHQPPVYIVLTMRSDYLGDCAEFRDLPETLNDCQYLVPRMTREQRREAIEGPLGRVEIAPALVQRLLNDAGDEPDQLPVLQHALMRTWNCWRTADPDQKRRIELLDYEAIGGLRDALDQHANELLTGMPADLTATIFKRLTAKGRSSRERRNPARLAELWAVCGAATPEQQAEVTTVVEHFRRGEATFLVPREGAMSGDTYIDITHESLIRQWKKLRDEWLPDEQRSAKTFLDLVERARNWGEKKGELLIGLDLTDAVAWDRQRNATTAWAEHYASEAELGRVLEFIRASEKQRREQLARQRRERRRLQSAVTVAILAVVAVLSAIGFHQYSLAQHARSAAFQARILSVPSVRDPLVRALLLVELGEHAGPEHLAIYQQAATAAIPFAVVRSPEGDSVVGVGFLGDGRAAVALASGTLLSWSSDGRGDPVVGAIVEHGDRTSDGSAATLPRLTAAAFSHDGQRIAAGLANGTVWVGRSDKSAALRPIAAAETTPRADSAPVSALAFSRDGRKLAAGYIDYSVRIWQLDATTEGVLHTVPIEIVKGHTGAISTVDFDPTGARVASGAGDATTRIWNLDDRAKRSVTSKGDDAVTCVAFSPDGAWVLSGYKNGAIRIRRSAQDGPSEAPALPEHTAAVTSAAFSFSHDQSHDQLKVVTASEDRTARIWTIRSRERSKDQSASLQAVGSPTVLTHDAQVTAVAFSEDGKRIVSASRDGTVRLWWSEQGEPRILGMHEGRLESVAFSPDAKHVVSASDDHTARIWSIDGASKSEILAGHNDWVRSAAFSPAEELTVVTASDDGTLRLWDLAVPGKSKLSQEGSTVFAAAFDRDGARVVTAVRDNTARVWNLSTLVRGDRPLEIPEQSEVVELHHPDWVLGAAFSSDGTKIVTASRDGTARIWASERSSHEPVRLFVHPRGTVVFSAAFSPDGSRIVTASADGVARIWRVDGKDEPITLRHTEQVNKATFSPSGDWIVTASTDRTAKLWRDGGERMVLQHATEVRDASFDSAEARVATGTADGVVRVWRIALPGLREYLSQASTACVTPTMRVQFLGELEEQARSHYEACERGYGRTPARYPRLGGTSPGPGHSPA